MVNVQVWLNENYPKEKRENVKKISFRDVNLEGHLDLRDFVNLEYLNCWNNQITNLEFSNCFELIYLQLANNPFQNIDFLIHLPKPEKIIYLLLGNNNVESTDIEFFKLFVNVKWLHIGTNKEGLEKGYHNKFYGSLKSYQNLVKLEEICIEATDVNEGLEYLSFSLAKSITERGSENHGSGYPKIECSPHGTEAKCSAIQD